jgi:tetratricopeptide (TPR) repeat protein
LLHGASLLDVAPTILTLYRLPVGEDMDGKVLSEAFVKAPDVMSIPSWEEVPGADGRHPLHTRFDAVASQEALDQMIALGYIERPDENRELAINKTIRELRYNLGESYQDGGRHGEAREIFTELCRADPDEQRFAVRLFASCQALGLHEEMRCIVDKLHQSPLVDYLQAQVLITEKRYAEALETLARVSEASLVRPDLLVQTADLYLKLGRADEARQVYEKALAMDPDDVLAHLGLCRSALRKGEYGIAAHSALDAVERTHQDPLAHFLLGRALAGMKEYERAVEAFRAAISFNPNFPEAHLRLAALLEKHLGDIESAREHRKLARSMRDHGGQGSTPMPVGKDAAVVTTPPETRVIPDNAEIPSLSESLIIVTGLPRSGTSLLMQMLAAGGMDILSDGAREADEDNPRGYLEFEPVKGLRNNSKWLLDARGKTIKIVAPLLTALPPSLPCRVILSERDLDEVIDSQDRMLQRRNQPLATTPERRRMLKDEYRRVLERVKAMLARRPRTQLLVVEYSAAISNSLGVAGMLNSFLGGGLDVAKMAAAVEPALHRNRAGGSNRAVLAKP